MGQSVFDWSLLPHDVLSEIVLKLDTVEEFLNFSFVCHAWNYASSLIKYKWRSRFPWLLLAENTENNHDYSRKLFSLNRNKIYELKLPHTFGGRCWGSSCGWIVVFDLNLQISLFNPLTQDQIFLPPQSAMPNQVELFDRSDMEKKEWLRRGFIYNVFVWKLNEDDLLIIAVHGGIEMKLAFARPGDQVWTSIITPDKIGVVDIVYWHGQMLIMYEGGAVGCCDMSGASSLQPLKALDYLPAPDGILDKCLRRINNLYMVDSFGDLLMVLRYKIDGDLNDINNTHELGEEEEEEEEEEEGEEEEEEEGEFSYKTTTFEVFKLNFDTKEWEQVKDIGDVALFVGDSCTMSVRASNSNNCKRNCIYFTDDEFQFWRWVRNFGGHDMGVFDIETGMFRAIYEGEDKHSKFCTPFWFIPSFL